jgi:hypothetical protein
MKKLFLLMGVLGILASSAYAQQKYNGLDAGMGNIYRTSDAVSRSISPENFTGEKGKGGMATTGTGAGRLARSGPDLEGEPQRYPSKSILPTPLPKLTAKALFSTFG